MSLQTSSPSSIWGFIRQIGQTLGLQTSASGVRPRAGVLWGHKQKVTLSQPVPPQHLLPLFLQLPIKEESGHKPSALTPPCRFQLRLPCSNPAAPEAGCARAQKPGDAFGVLELASAASSTSHCSSPHPALLKQVPASNRHHQCLNFGASGQVLGAKPLPSASSPERAAPRRDGTLNNKGVTLRSWGVHTGGAHLQVSCCTSALRRAPACWDPGKKGP